MNMILLFAIDPPAKGQLKMLSRAAIVVGRLFNGKRVCAFHLTGVLSLQRGCHLDLQISASTE
jgi:hypothetical protein